MRDAKLHAIKDAKLYIFDMDGTLLDSMPAWAHLGRNYLIREHITPPADLEKIIDPMTLQESAAYFQTLGLDKKTDDIVEEIMSFLREQYRLSIPAKPGMLPLLDVLSKRQNSILCVLTTSEKDCAIQAFKRLHVLSYFTDIYTSEELGLSKRTGEIYQTVCAHYGVSCADTVVFEDALYAIQSAKAAGCYVYAIPDEYSRADFDQILTQADEIFQP